MIRYQEDLVQPKVQKGLQDKVGFATRRAVTRASNSRVFGTIESFSTSGPQLRAAKERAIGGLEELVKKAVCKLQDNGFQVFRARTSADAVAYASAIIKPGSIVVKSKSNAAKETGILETLATIGVTVVETDMGDRVCQLGDIAPSHPLGPAIHVPVAKVAELFSRETGQVVEPDHAGIVRIARDLLRQDFLRADFGISGANAIAADTGSVVVTENEGNIRTVTNLPRVHLVFAGIEKIVETLEDAVHVCHTAAVYGTGQSIGQYISVISSPARTTAVEGKLTQGGQGPEQVHIILLEEGRWEALHQGCAESLFCINCGRCLSVCPVYRELGEQYGYKYFGGIGIIHTALRNGLDKAAANGLSLCVGCRQCMERCPSRISTPKMIQRLRQQAVRQYGLKLSKKLVIRHFLGRKTYLIPKAARIVQRIAFRKTGGGTNLRFSMGGIDKNRLIPAFAPKPAVLEVPEFSRSASGTRKVAYFAGCLHNLFFPEITRAGIQLLNQNNISVFVPHGQLCCGYPMLSAGEPELAKEMARRNLEAFQKEQVDAILVDCATCGTALRGYGELLAGDPAWELPARQFSESVQDFFEFLYKDLEANPPQGKLQGKVTYHEPCHLKSLGLNQSSLALKLIPGLQVEATQEEACCGFGGAFSLDHYDLSATIAEHRLESCNQTGSTLLATACPGCMIHLADTLSRQGSPVTPKHIIELLAESYSKQGS